MDPLRWVLSRAPDRGSAKEDAIAGRQELREHVRFLDLRHTFGTRVAAAGVPLRTLQEWMGHRDFKTTLIYADYQPKDQEAELVRRAFARFPRRPGAR